MLRDISDAFDSLSVSFPAFDGALAAPHALAGIDLGPRRSMADPDLTSPLSRSGFEAGLHASSPGMQFAMPMQSNGFVAGTPGPALTMVSPTMDEQRAFLSGVDASGVVVATSFRTWNGDVPGTFSGPSDAYKWDTFQATNNTVSVVEYWFDPGSSWTATEKEVMEKCMALWSALTNVTFVESDGANPELTFERNNSSFASMSGAIQSISGSGTIGGTTIKRIVDATISIDTGVYGPFDGKFTTDGGDPWQTLLHEIGHAIGLGHGGAYNANIDPMTQQFSAYDSYAWTIMSYVHPVEGAKYDGEYPVFTDWGFGQGGALNMPTTPMGLDILAIQDLYGTPNDSLLDGGDTFGFNCTVAEPIADFFDFTVNKNPVVTLYSTGTNNTLDLSKFQFGSTVDLNPGTFSSCDEMVANIFIAHGTIIETAIGGKGVDFMTASAAGSTLKGGANSDTLNGGAGKDKLIAGSGGDLMEGNALGDILKCGGDDDSLLYDTPDVSSSTQFDTAQKFDFLNADRFVVPGTVNQIGPAVTTGTLSNSTFDSDMATALAGTLFATARLFRPDAGDYAGKTFLYVDANGLNGYQVNGDIIILLKKPLNIGSIDTTDFG
jgi:hypothetical protein